MEAAGYECMGCRNFNAGTSKMLIESVLKKSWSAFSDGLDIVLTGLRSRKKFNSWNGSLLNSAEEEKTLNYLFNLHHF